MKNNILILISFLFLVSCGSKKNVTTTHTRDQTKTQLDVEKTTNQDSSSVINIKTEDVIDSISSKTTIEIEYEPFLLNDTVIPILKKKTITRQEFNKKYSKDIDITSTVKDQKNKVETTNLIEQKDKEQDKKQKEVPKTNWKYIFYILVVIGLVILFFWMKKLTNGFNIFNHM